MKQFALIISAICILIASTVEAQTIDDQLNNYTLENIQDKIQSALFSDFGASKPIELTKIYSDLNKLYAQKESNIIAYWSAYTQHYIAILHLKTGDKAKSELFTTQAVDLLESLEEKGVEEYALLSMIQGFSTTFAGASIVSVGMDISKNSETALSLDSENLRANLIAGICDFHTPKMFGGGKNAEKYFLKAISVPAQTLPNKQLPSWGKEEAYQYLIEFYIKEKEREKASKFLDEALNLYPDSYQINQLQSSVDKLK